MSAGGAGGVAAAPLLSLGSTRADSERLSALLCAHLPPTSPGGNPTSEGRAAVPQPPLPSRRERLVVDLSTMNLRTIWQRIAGRPKPEPAPDPRETPEDQVAAEDRAELLREHNAKRDDPRGPPGPPTEPV